MSDIAAASLLKKGAPQPQMPGDRPHRCRHNTAAGQVRLTRHTLTRLCTTEYVAAMTLLDRGFQGQRGARAGSAPGRELASATPPRSAGQGRDLTGPYRGPPDPDWGPPGPDRARLAQTWAEPPAVALCRRVCALNSSARGLRRHDCGRRRTERLDCQGAAPPAGPPRATTAERAGQGRARRRRHRAGFARRRSPTAAGREGGEIKEPGPARVGPCVARGERPQERDEAV
jgi:hypothetical protein